MTGHELVEEYLAALRQQLVWQPHGDDVVAEVADHLHTATDRLVATGSDSLEAQRRVLHSFGDAEVIAIAFSRTPQGGVAVPTAATRNLGQVGIAAALWWLAWGAMIFLASAAMMVDEYRFGDLADTVMWSGFLFTLVAGAPLTHALFAGLLIRAGTGTRNTWVLLVMALAAVTAVFGILGWARGACGAGQARTGGCVTCIILASRSD